MSTEGVDAALVAFLRARLDEDERIAQECIATGNDERWRFDYHGRPVARIVGAPWESSYGDGTWNCDDPLDGCDELRRHGTTSGEHIARHDPARVLRDVEAQRRILLEYSVPDGIDAVYAGTERETGFRLAMSFAVKALAYAYRDHPDFREELVASSAA